MAGSPTDLSIVDLAPIPEDGTTTEAFENTRPNAPERPSLSATRGSGSPNTMTSPTGWPAPPPRC
jgi:hypothetical protein